MEYSELKKRHFGNNDTDKKLTDEEVVKALECCKDCSINLNFEIVQKIEDKNKEILELIDIINSLKAEIEKLEKENTVFGEIIKKQDDEISALRKDLLKRENLEESFSKSVKQFDKRLEKTVKLERAEAIKEFAGIIKNKWFDNRYDSPDVDFDDFISNLLKEMVGEEK